MIDFDKFLKAMSLPEDKQVSKPPAHDKSLSEECAERESASIVAVPEKDYSSNSKPVSDSLEIEIDYSTYMPRPVCTEPWHYHSTIMLVQ